MKTLLTTLLLLTSSAYAQCPPPMEPMSTTVRLPDSGIVVVVGEYDGETRTVVSSYEHTEWNEGKIGTMMGDGDITFTNKTNQNRRMKYRISVLLPEGSVPMIPDGSDLCWEPDNSRIIVVYQAVVNANQEVVVPISWNVAIKNAGMLADLNGDGRVDAADQGILMGAWGTSDAIADLNQDGIVNAQDLGILLSNWSDYSEDVIETSSATTNWDSADFIIAADIVTDPVRGGNGQVRVPFLVLT
jgi:hypothetical protein